MTEQDRTPQNYGAYISALFAPEDEALLATRSEMEREGLPRINVSPSTGQLLHVLALTVGAKRILEVGTLGGYSGTWLARALPEDGKLISLELDAHHADVARRNLERAGLGHKIEIRVGPASESLAQMEASGEAPFDLVFIDADKDGYVDYLHKALTLTREGSLILGDNALPDAVLDPDATSGTKRYNAAVAAHPDLVAVTVPTLGGRGIDGLTIAVKRTGQK